MPLIDADGVSITFPFEPYDCQVAYMQKVMQCLKMGQNAILESPTGTGKTLCLLCSTLAYLEGKKAQLTSKRWEIAAAVKEDAESVGVKLQNQYKEELAGKLSDAVGAWSGELAPPRIIYASRTHSQLTQAVQELKRTAYRHMKVCVLGSREQLCIHDQVSKEENNATKVHLCRAKVSARTCHFYNNVENSKQNFGNDVMDIEDLVAKGKKLKCCPYYTAREMKAEADIIFLPYNYLVDPKSRRAHGVELNGNIVIFDEAHNLEKICEDSVSFDWTSSEIAAAIRDLEEVSEKLTSMIADEEENTTSFDLDADTKTTPDFNIGQVLALKSMLHKIEQALDEIVISKKEGIPKPGDFLYELFSRADLRFSNKDEHLDVLDKLVMYLTTDATSSIFSRKGAGLNKFAEVLKIAFSRDPTNAYTPITNHQQVVSKHYKVFIKELQKETNKKKKGGWDAEPVSNKAGRVLSYWCFSPGAAMEELKAQGVKSIILTSGTLSPMSSFKTEMGIKFDVELENAHVIEKKQVWIGVVGKGPDGTRLSSDYETRFKPEYQASLGNAMVNFARIVPHGLLLFFPSYPVMDKCLESWTGQNIWNRVEQYKPIFIEPKRKQDFLLAMENFYQKVNDPAANGAVFAAVCRGKVSEGLDFSDNNGRAVVILGLPFPPRMDPKVQLKMQYLDELRFRGGNGLSGREWYRQQASRAVNQAIGRVIRHKQDYGAIILCDNRFANKESVDQLPRWVKPYLNVYSTFGQAVRDVMVFFKTAEQNLPAPTSKKQRMRAGEPGCSGAFFEPAVKSRTKPNVAQLEKSSDVVMHMPSLRQQPESGSSITKLTLQYKGSDVTKSTQGYTNFLDALDSQKSGPIDFNAVKQPEAQQSVFGALPTRNNTATKPRKKIILKKNPTSNEGIRDAPTKEETEIKDKRKHVARENLKDAEEYIDQIKRALSTESYRFFTTTLKEYRNTQAFDTMVTRLADLFTDNPDNYHLFKKFARFVRPRHKQQFDEACISLLGEASGFALNEQAKAQKRPLSDNQKLENCKKLKEDGLFKKPLDIKAAKAQSIGSVPSNLDLKTNRRTNDISTHQAPGTSAVPTISSHKISVFDVNELHKNGTSIPRPQSAEENDSAISSENKTEQDTVKGVDPLVLKAEISNPKLSGCASSVCISNEESSNPVEVQTVCDKVLDSRNQNESSMALTASEMVDNTKKFVMENTISGLTCESCQSDAKGPLKAQCGHVCCVQCWKIEISERKECPRCKVKVKRKHLSRVFYPQGHAKMLQLENKQEVS